MKKIIAGLFATILVVAGLAAFSSSSASASPYPGTIPTYCRANAANAPFKGRPARVNFKVGTQGNGQPSGVVTFTYRMNGEVMRTFKRNYEGGYETYTLGTLPKRGVYRVRARFNSLPANSAYMNCGHSFDQRRRGQRP